MTIQPDYEILYQGKYLALAKRGTWEFATRPQGTGVVAIVAITDDDKVILVEQHRPPAAGPVIELPAGLSGDEDASESPLQAAKRELQEETGYTAEQWTELTTGLSSSGLSDETVTFFLARKLHKTSPGGGVGTEAITVHEVPLNQIRQWLADKTSQKTQFNLKLLAGLYAAQQY